MLTLIQHLSRLLTITPTHSLTTFMMRLLLREITLWLMGQAIPFKEQEAGKEWTLQEEETLQSKIWKSNNSSLEYI